MKTTRKWLPLILAAVLALSLSVPALAVEPEARPEDIAAEFMALLDRDGVQYTDLGFDSSDVYEINVIYPGKNREEHEVYIYIDDDGEAFSAFEWYLMEYDPEKLTDVLQVVNSLNNTYRIVAFLADTSDNTITAETHGVLRGKAELAARVMYTTCGYLPLLVEDAWTELTETIPTAPEQPEEPDFAGTWKFATLTFTVENNGVPAGTVLTAEDFGTAQVFLLELKESGEMALSSFGIKTEGTWVRNGDSATLSDETGDFVVELLDKNTLWLDASEDGGYIMTLERAE